MSSVGNDAIRNIGAVFTNLYPINMNAATAREQAETLSEELRNLNIVGVPEDFPHWFLDNCPEITNETIKSVLDLEK